MTAIDIRHFLRIQTQVKFAAILRILLDEMKEVLELASGAWGAGDILAQPVKARLERGQWALRLFAGVHSWPRGMGLVSYRGFQGMARSRMTAVMRWEAGRKKSWAGDDGASENFARWGASRRCRLSCYVK